MISRMIPLLADGHAVGANNNISSPPILQQNLGGIKWPAISREFPDNFLKSYQSVFLIFICLMIQNLGFFKEM